MYTKSTARIHSTGNLCSRLKGQEGLIAAPYLEGYEEVACPK